MREFVAAARYMGVSNWRIIVRHILPNVASILIIDTALNVGVAILAETGLSFLGFGIQPPDVSLGTLIADGTKSATTFPWVFLFPAGVLVLIVLCANLIGDGLRDAIDPGSARAAEEASQMSLLEVTDLTVTFPTDTERVDGGARHELPRRPRRSRRARRRIRRRQVGQRDGRRRAAARVRRGVGIGPAARRRTARPCPTNGCRGSAAGRSAPCSRTRCRR